VATYDHLARWVVDSTHATEAAAQERAELLTRVDSTEPVPLRLSVDLARMTITLGGAAYDVPSRAALRWVKVLSTHPGEWVSGTDLARHDPELDGTRTDRLRRHLPPEVLALIDSAPRRGSRLRLPLA
jgi:hypothetical protein